jgi:hypothetical protein
MGFSTQNPGWLLEKGGFFASSSHDPICNWKFRKVLFQYQKSGSIASGYLAKGRRRVILFYDSIHSGTWNITKIVCTVDCSLFLLFLIKNMNEFMDQCYVERILRRCH